MISNIRPRELILLSTLLPACVVQTEKIGCAPGDFVLCYSGPPETLDIGVCKAGVRTCTADGTFGECTGEALPAAQEDCSTIHDDDCDGVSLDLPEGCVCHPGTARTCYTGPPGTEGIGMCRQGVEVCSPDGKDYLSCVGDVTPVAETCSTPEDDDCDGLLNNTCPCMPGEIAACYSGPADTMGVGVCRAGLHICTINEQFTECIDEVLPMKEDCTNAEDEDCDGIACSQPLWARSFGSAGRDVVNDVVIDNLGNMILVGRFTTILDFGCGSLTTKGGTDIFLAKFDSDGNCIWSNSFGGPADDNATAVAVDSSGDIAITGWISGPVDFGGGFLAWAAAVDPFLAKFSTAGKHLWSRSYEDTGSGIGADVAFNSSGDVLFTGRLEGAITYEGGALNAVLLDVVVAKYDFAGNHLWTRIFGDSNHQEGSGIATDENNNVFLIGSFMGTLDLGSNPLSSAGDWDAFVAKLDAAGNHVWSKRFGAEGTDSGWEIALDNAQGVIVTGVLNDGPADFGGAPLTAAGGDDAFLARLEQTTGNHLWSQCFGDGDNQVGTHVTTDSTGNVVLVGRNDGTINVGGDAISSAGDVDVFVVKFGPSGNHLWSKGFGDVGQDEARTVAVTPSGHVVVAGVFQLNPDFGLGPLSNAGGLHDIFVAGFAP